MTLTCTCGWDGVTWSEAKDHIVAAMHSEPGVVHEVRKTHKLPEPRGEWRSVSGWGPRCGCGGKSVLHWRNGREVTPETSVFLCAGCMAEGLTDFLLAHPDQPPYWPGDEGRDEAYAPPQINLHTPLDIA